MKKNIFLAFFLFVFAFVSCATVRYAAPYSLFGEFSSAPEGVLLNFSLTNNAQSQIEKICFVLGAYDSDGEPVFEGDSLQIELKLCVLPGKTVEDYFNVDFLNDFSEDDFKLDYFYAEKIFYSDGSVFEDSLGRFAQ